MRKGTTPSTQNMSLSRAILFAYVPCATMSAVFDSFSISSRWLAQRGVSVVIKFSSSVTAHSLCFDKAVFYFVCLCFVPFFLSDFQARVHLLSGDPGRVHTPTPQHLVSSMDLGGYGVGAGSLMGLF